MDTTKPILRSFADEHVIGIDPPMRPSLPNVWRRRIHAFAGRSISDKALTAEQSLRSGMQRLYGLSLAPGAVQGLALSADPSAIGAAPGEATISLESGFGLARTGEDVSVGRTVRLPIGRLPVIARVGGGGGGASPETAAAEGVSLAGRLRPEAPRTMGESLAGRILAGTAGDLPRAAVIVAQPVVAELVGTPLGDCRPDPREDPYIDLQRIDGMRLALYCWPDEMVALDGGADYSLPPSGPAWRNRLAHAVFAAEALFPPDQGHPWEAWGVPLALAGFADDWSLLFVDRHAVVRAGGTPRSRFRAGMNGGDARLWQARLDQFTAQLGEMSQLDAVTLQAAFERLPPIGLLPSAMFDPFLRKQHFFPGGSEMTAVPVAYSNLDLALAEAAGLTAMDRGDPDGVELLVPVPDEFYEPRLLQTETADSRFGTAISQLRDARTEALIRRQMARRRHDRLIETVSGEVQGWPDADLPLEENSPSPHLQVPVEVTRTRRFAENSAKRSHELLRAHATLTVANGDRIWFWVKIHDRSRMTGLSLRAGHERGSEGSPKFMQGVYWGAPDVLPIAADGGLPARRVGDLPETGGWVRLEVPAEFAWDANGGSLAGLAIDSVEFAQRGGDVEWASFGKLDKLGRIYTYFADDAPAGGTLTVDNSQPGWPWQTVDGRDTLSVPDFGTMLTGDVRQAAALEAFRDEWNQTFLADDLDAVDDNGIGVFLASVDARLKATNDAIDLGFVRARSDIYRVRQIMLGADAASRLVTSPALADLAVRDEGARATSEKIGSFLEAAVTRGAGAGAFAIEPKAENAPAAGGGTFTPKLMTLNVERVSLLASAPAPAPAPSPSPIGALRTFSPMIASTPLMMSAAIPIASPEPAPAPVTTRTALATGSALSSGSFLSGSVLRSTAFLPARSIATASLDLDITRFHAVDVQHQSPVAGLVERTVSVAERLRPQPAVEALQYAIASKAAVIRTLQGLVGQVSGHPVGVALGDLPMAGFQTSDGSRTPTLDELLAAQQADPRQFVDLDTMPSSTEGKHEAEYFSLAVEAIDNSIAIMRLVEGRVALFESLASALGRLRDSILGSASDAGTYLRQVDSEVAELRHDLGTAERLRDEEDTRVAAINDRRGRVLVDKVKAVAWRRRRRADVHDEVAISPCSSALVETPLVICRRDHPDVPEEVHQYVQLLREVPVSWFPRIAAMVDRIDRLEPVRRTIETVRERAVIPRSLAPLPVVSSQQRFVVAVHQALAVGRQKIADHRGAIATVNLALLPQLSLVQGQSQVKAMATLGDLLVGTHGKPEITRAAIDLLAAITDTGGCLLDNFGSVAPIVRLAWAETLSEFDRPAPLYSLVALPQWSQVPAELRRTLQGLVDFVFAQVDIQNEDARDAMNEYVRVCLLMAAHAPVDRIIPARLVEPAPAKVGARLSLAIDVTRVTKGMLALVRDDRDRIVSQAVIDDIADGMAQARITQLHAAITTIVPTMRIELAGMKLR